MVCTRYIRNTGAGAGVPPFDWAMGKECPEKDFLEDVISELGPERQVRFYQMNNVSPFYGGA